MSVAVITGSAGLIGSEACKRFHQAGLDVAGLDNDMRARFFGAEASTLNNRKTFERRLARYSHHDIDIRDGEAINTLFRRYSKVVEVVVQNVANASHVWAA